MYEIKQYFLLIFQAILNKLFQLGLINEDMVENVPLNKIISMILCLAFLPPERIFEKYQHIKTLGTGEVREMLQNFFDYYGSYWISKVGTVGFSIFGLSRRTTNATEAYHASLIRRMGRYLTPWMFICKLLQIQNAAVVEVRKLTSGLQVARQPRYSTTFRDINLIKGKIFKYCMLNIQYFTYGTNIILSF